MTTPGPMSVFGYEIRRQRKLAGMTQVQLADRVGVHQTQISSIERGQTSDVKTVMKICEVLGIDHEPLAWQAFAGATEFEAHVRTDSHLTVQDRALLLVIYA